MSRTHWRVMANLKVETWNEIWAPAEWILEEEKKLVTYQGDWKSSIYTED